MKQFREVRQVEATDDHKLLLTFDTGERKIYDASILLDKEVFKPLRNIGLFKLAHVRWETVVWNDMIDIDADHLYKYSEPMQDK